MGKREKGKGEGTQSPEFTSEKRSKGGERRQKGFQSDIQVALFSLDRSVEHDFRLQEGQVTRAWKVPEQQESEQSSPQLVFPPPRQQDSPQALQTVKKSRRKCFWFL
ncbi:hypothetical protein PO909_026587 [Leuciscus waleckii]